MKEKDQKKNSSDQVMNKVIVMWAIGMAFLVINTATAIEKMKSLKSKVRKKMGKFTTKDSTGM